MLQGEDVVKLRKALRLAIKYQMEVDWDGLQQGPALKEVSFACSLVILPAPEPHYACDYSLACVQPVLPTANQRMPAVVSLQTVWIPSKHQHIVRSNSA